MKFQLVLSLIVVLMTASCMEAPITQDTNDEASSVESANITQLKQGDNEPVYTIASEVPVLLGGMDGLFQKIQYPEVAVKNGVEGRVHLTFIIDKNGDVRDAQVKSGIGSGCDEEALRVIRQAKFEPGRHNGKAVNVRMNMPVIFKLR